METQVQKTPLSDLLKKSLTAKLTKDEIVRLIKTAYYSRPISKPMQKELGLKDSQLDEKRCLKRIRKIATEPSTSKLNTSASSTAAPTKPTSPPKETTKPETIKDHKKQTPSAPETKPTVSKVDFKHPYYAELLKSDLVSPCDDCLLPFSKLTSTTLTSVTFICGLPQIDRALFSRCLSSRIATVKTSIKSKGLPVPPRLPKQIVSLLIHTLQRAIVKELNQRKAAKLQKRKKAKKSKKKVSPSPPKTKPVLGDPSTYRQFVPSTESELPPRAPTPQEERDTDTGIRSSRLLKVKLESALLSYAIGQLSLPSLAKLCPPKVTARINVNPEFGQSRLAFVTLKKSQLPSETSPGTQEARIPDRVFFEPSVLIHTYLSNRLRLLTLENSIGYDEAMSSSVSLDD
jgi:hypothetical protein